MVTETREVIEEHEEYRSTIVTTSTSMSFSKQNGTNGISIEDNVLYNGNASVKSVHLNGPAHNDQTCAIGSSEPEVTKSCVQPLISTENTRFLNGKCHHQIKVYLLAHQGGGCWSVAPYPCQSEL
jgi:hypothetical protein